MAELRSAAIGLEAPALPDRDDVLPLYAERVELGPEQTPRASAGTHTMGGAVEAYVAQRIPTAVVDRVLDAGGSVEVHGIHPDHVRHVLPGAVLVHPGAAFPATKVYNRIRPRWFQADRWSLVAAVPPGLDYVRHYASLVAHHVATRGLDRGTRCRVVHYPVAERRIAEWTRLADMVRPGDRVLMGYVNELVPLFADGSADLVGDGGNEHYGVARLRFRRSGEELCALGVRFSFWGCISGRLAAACQAVGAREIVYAGKLGCLTSPSDVYTRLFSPSSYLHLRDEAVLLDRGAAPPNGLLAAHPDLDSGVHVSVGTVLEEDIPQRARADAFGAVTIDNEIAQMAHALAVSAAPGHRAAFSALHFATDYLHRRREHAPAGVYNLTNHRRSDALLRKRAMLAQMAERLTSYFDRPTPDGDS